MSIGYGPGNDVGANRKEHGRIVGDVDRAAIVGHSRSLEHDIGRAAEAGGGHDGY